MDRKPGAWICEACAAARGLAYWGNCSAMPGWCAVGLHECDVVRWSSDAIAAGARPPWVSNRAGEAYLAANRLEPMPGSQPRPAPAVAPQLDLFGG